MEGHVHSEGCRIHYQVRGEGSPLVLLMGFGAPGSLWEKHVAEYEKHFQCILIDNRGVGASDAPSGPYSTSLMAKDTIAVMNHLNIAQAQIAGISMGGAIAQSTAIEYPERVKSLVLISTWPSFNRYATTVYENLKKIRRVAKPSDFMELLQLWIFAPPHYEKEYDELVEGQKQAQTDRHPQSQNGFDGQLDACIGHDVVEHLHKIKVPTLITIGMMDIFTPPPFSQILHEQIPNSTMIEFPEGGHVHHWEDLPRFNKVTTDFLIEQQ